MSALSMEYIDNAILDILKSEPNTFFLPHSLWEKLVKNEPAAATSINSLFQMKYKYGKKNQHPPCLMGIMKRVELLMKKMPGKIEQRLLNTATVKITSEKCCDYICECQTIPIWRFIQ